MGQCWPEASEGPHREGPPLPVHVAGSKEGPALAQGVWEDTENLTGLGWKLPLKWLGQVSGPLGAESRSPPPLGRRIWRPLSSSHPFISALLDFSFSSLVKLLWEKS